MASTSASLLTEKQRESVETAFEEYEDEAKRARDRKQVRDRIERGIYDFHRLQESGYDNEELQLIFAGVREDEQLAEALVAMATFHQRAVWQTHLDYDEVIEQATATVEGPHQSTRESNNSVATDKTGSTQSPSTSGEPVTRWQLLSTMTGMGYLVLATTLTIQLPVIILGGLAIVGFILLSFIWPSGEWFEKLAGSTPSSNTADEEVR